MKVQEENFNQNICDQSTNRNKEFNPKFCFPLATANWNAQAADYEQPYEQNIILIKNLVGPLWLAVCVVVINYFSTAVEMSIERKFS